MLNASYVKLIRAHFKTVDEIIRAKTEENELINVERYLRDLPKIPLAFELPSPPTFRWFISKRKM